ncbi:RING [Musa troglodytarum]|uniref:RING n=1 Tax=Musa troglodytarum TaxID=320322 RepID=A0A9E7EPH9_9LILI|nr:RING [Musa troglodytarum]
MASGDLERGRKPNEIGRRRRKTTAGNRRRGARAALGSVDADPKSHTLYYLISSLSLFFFFFGQRDFESLDIIVSKATTFFWRILLRRSDLDMEGRELRRSVTLLEQLSVTDSSKLEGLLKVREEDDVRISRRRGRDSLTMRSIVAGEKREDSAAGRTLLEIIQHDRAANGNAADRNSSNGDTWKSLRDLLRHGDGVALAAATPGDLQPISATELDMDSTRPNPVPALSVSVGSPPDFAASESTAVAATAATATATTTPVELPVTNEGGSEEINGSENSNPVGAAGSSAPEEQQSARVSLLALLEQTDRQWEGSGQEGLSLVAAAVEEEEVVAEDETRGSGGVSYMCCVCMVRHKGAAFIPCGHTFCRLCSRELWVSRGNCPLCNAHILEILDIY